MTRDKLQENIEQLTEKVTQMLAAKGPEYQHGENVFSNFETNANDLGLSRYQIWSVYFSKHVKSIINAIKNNPDNPGKAKLSEEYQGRIVDAIAYLHLLNAMIEEEKSKPKSNITFVSC
jgi:hypothetical protein